MARNKNNNLKGIKLTLVFIVIVWSKMEVRKNRPKRRVDVNY